MSEDKNGHAQAQPPLSPGVIIKLLAARDALIRDDYDDAYHQLYSIADPTFALRDPFNEWEKAVNYKCDPKLGPAEQPAPPRCEDCAWHGCAPSCGCKCHKAGSSQPSAPPQPAQLDNFQGDDGDEDADESYGMRPSVEAGQPHAFFGGTVCWIEGCGKPHDNSIHKVHPDPPKEGTPEYVAEQILTFQGENDSYEDPEPIAKLIAAYAAALTQERDALRRALDFMKVGDCWCEPTDNIHESWCDVARAVAEESQPK